MYIHFFGYRKVVYKDDGRDYVTFSEYVSINCTFSCLHSWVTYFCIFSFFKSYFDWEGIENNDYEKLKQLDIGIIGVFAMALMFIEMTIYLVYRKDVIFGLMTLADFVGMYLNK